MTRGGVEGEPAPRSALGLLADRNFGPYFAGRVTSSLGIWVQNITAAVVMWGLTGSAFLVGAVSVMQFLGPLMLSLWMGALTDRLDRRWMLASGRIVSALAALGLCLGAAIPTEGLRVSWVLAMACMLGVGLAISSPAMHALVPGLIPVRDLDQAVAMNTMVGSIARSVGPALGAFLVVFGGPALAFGFASLAHCIFFIALVFIRPKPQARTSEKKGVMGGLRYVARSPAVLFLLIAAAALSFGIDPVITLTPAIAAGLGGTEQTVGLLASVFGVGATMTALALRRLRGYVSLRRLGTSGFIIQAVGLVVIALATTQSQAVVGFLVTGSGFLLGNTVANTRIQRRVPDHLRGRVMGLWTIAFLGSRPLAAAVNGLIADHVSVSAALFVGATIAILSVMLMNVRFGPSGDAAG